MEFQGAISRAKFNFRGVLQTCFIFFLWGGGLGIFKQLACNLMSLNQLVYLQNHSGCMMSIT